LETPEKMVSTFVNKLCSFWVSQNRVKMHTERKFMPGWKTHMILGAATGATINIAMQTCRMAVDPKPEFSWGELILCTVTAGGAAMLPDLLEPANSPNHRAFFHSVACAALVAYAITGKHTGKWPAIVTLIVGAAGVGYLSHLAADATTPKSINFH
jgi:membrane-bound metal-dependent hydrolase YbcI (DUF457 family)